MQIFDFQEEFQRDAFEALQLQKDAKTQRISQQINMIEEELAGLTLVELQRKEERTDDEIVSMDHTLLRGIQSGRVSIDLQNTKCIFWHQGDEI